MSSRAFKLPAEIFHLLYQKAYGTVSAGTRMIRVNGKNRFR
jgi:hypothetical protein